MLPRDGSEGAADHRRQRTTLTRATLQRKARSEHGGNIEKCKRILFSVEGLKATDLT
jgi:hypothetical protein